MSSPEWMVRGACVGVNTDVFFPPRHMSATTAKAICATCPVKPECLDYAIGERIEFGIWGGTSQNERRVLIRERRRLAA